MNKEKKEEIISRIMSDVESNLYNYKEFVLDCVRKQVEKWDKDALLDWIEGDE